MGAKCALGAWDDGTRTRKPASGVAPRGPAGATPRCSGADLLRGHPGTHRTLVALAHCSPSLVFVYFLLMMDTVGRNPPLTSAQWSKRCISASGRFLAANRMKGTIPNAIRSIHKMAGKRHLSPRNFPQLAGRLSGSVLTCR